jgi:hypothetical protein
VRRRKHGEPDHFQWSGFAINEQPASNAVARAAVKRFVALFVVENRRERAPMVLLHRDWRRRLRAIWNLSRWIDGAYSRELDGSSGSPQHLRERFGDMRGILLDERCARHVTVAGAAILAAVSGFGALFIADTKPIAIIFEEVGHPTVCSR